MPKKNLILKGMLALVAVMFVTNSSWFMSKTKTDYEVLKEEPKVMQ